MRRIGSGKGSIITILMILFLIMVALPTLVNAVQSLIIPAIILTVLVGIIMLVFQRKRWWLRLHLNDGTYRSVTAYRRGVRGRDIRGQSCRPG
jgi:hypothetical protein